MNFILSFRMIREAGGKDRLEKETEQRLTGIKIVARNESDENGRRIPQGNGKHGRMNGRAFLPVFNIPGF
jgi:hypothetical protein